MAASPGAARGLLRFITCGSVDDGKSTLIGRLLHDSGAVLLDQQVALEADSRRWGTQGDAVDYALLLDGLAAEREQGITIDVAHRYFSTPTRKFIVADTPGHEQYTRNMVTGASTADAAVLLLDARKGLSPQTRRHSLICHLMGVQQLVLAVNKMDLVDYDEARFDEIRAVYQDFAARLGVASVEAIPLSALTGEQVTRAGVAMPWYRGPTLLQWLESVTVDLDRARSRPLRLPVQWVNRPHADFRGYAGRVASGTLAPGDAVTVLPSGRSTQIARIIGWQRDEPTAVAGQSVMVTLVHEIGVSRGDVLVAAASPPPLAQQLEAHLVWLEDAPLVQGRQYQLKLGTATCLAAVTQLQHRLDVVLARTEPAATLALNDIGLATLELDRPLPVETYEDSRELGGFILIDRVSHQTCAAGMIRRALQGEARHIRWQGQPVSREERLRLTGHRSAVVWLTGLSGSGKSTLASLVSRQLHAAGVLTYVLDGDNVRHGLNRDLGFSDSDRAENIRRAAEVAKLMVDAGVLVIVAFISPFRAERAMARELFVPGDFIEVHVDVPLAVAETRDPKGLYRLARAGRLKHFTGIDSAYEPPDTPDLRLDAAGAEPEVCARQLMDLLLRRGLLDKATAPG